jgi:hypothetical protein
VFDFLSFCTYLVCKKKVRFGIIIKVILILSIVVCYFSKCNCVDEHFGDGGNSLFSWPCKLHAPHAINFNQPWFGMFNQYSTCLFISSVMTRPSIDHIYPNIHVAWPSALKFHHTWPTIHFPHWSPWTSTLSLIFITHYIPLSIKFLDCSHSSIRSHQLGLA